MSISLHNSKPGPAFPEGNSPVAGKKLQTIYIGGREVSGLSAYNIGGNNYFNLRELSGLLGYSVDYNEKTDTAIITTR